MKNETIVPLLYNHSILDISMIKYRDSNVRDMEYIFIRPFLKMKLNKKVLEIKHFLESFSK